jgi:hypothetical protein
MHSDSAKMKMSKRRQLDRESLEVYLLHLLLAYRPLLQVMGLLLFVLAFVTSSLSPRAGIFVLGLAVIFLIATFSYSVLLYIARLGAWIGTVWKWED